MPRWVWALLVSLLPLYGSKLHFTQEERAFIQNHPVVTYGNAVWEPFVIKEPQGYSGIFKDYYKLLEEKTGLTFKFVRFGDGNNFKLALDAFQKREIDLIQGSGKTAQREQYARFAGPFLQVSLGIVSQERHAYQRCHDLEGKVVAIAKGSTASEHIKAKFPGIKLIYTDTIQEALELVEMGNADAVVDNLVVLNYLLNKEYFRELAIGGICHYKFKIYALVRSDYPLLHSILNKAIASISQEEILSNHEKLLNLTILPDKKISDDYRAYFQSKKEITMCIDPNWMPLEAIEQGRMIGVNKEFIDLVQSYLPIPIRLVPTTNWSESITFAKERKCDILSLAMETTNRKKYLNFTSGYLKVSNVIVSKEALPASFELSHMEQRKIGVVQGYAMAEILKRAYPHIQFVDVESVVDGLEHVQEGSIDGFVATSLAVAYNFQSGQYKDLNVMTILPQKLDLGFGVRSDDLQLLAVLQHIVEQIPQSKREAIFNQWITIKFNDNEQAYKIFRNVLWVTLGMLFFILYYSYHSRKLNQKLQKNLATQIERIREQDKMIFHQNKLAAMGEMIENIAHQWRQPLAQINSAISVIDSRLYQNKTEDIVIDAKLIEIEQMTGYMSQTIDDFHHFLDQDRPKELFCLYNIVEKAIEILRGPLESCQITIEIDMDRHTAVEGYANEFLHVLVSILSNAKDILEQRSIPNPKITLRLHQSEQESQLIICDNGGGVESGMEDKVFEPYFSTKEKMKGRGLGLYISKMIVQKSLKGDIQLSNTDEGACFRIDFNQQGGVSNV